MKKLIYFIFLTFAILQLQLSAQINPQNDVKVLEQISNKRYYSIEISRIDQNIITYLDSLGFLQVEKTQNSIKGMIPSDKLDKLKERSIHYSIIYEEENGLNLYRLPSSINILSTNDIDKTIEKKGSEYSTSDGDVQSDNIYTNGVRLSAGSSSGSVIYRFLLDNEPSYTQLSAGVYCKDTGIISSYGVQILIYDWSTSEWVSKGYCGKNETLYSTGDLNTTIGKYINSSNKQVSVKLYASWEKDSHIKYVRVNYSYPIILNVNPTSLYFGSSKTSDNFTISSNISWTVSDNKNWISASPSSGSGDGTVTVQVNRSGLIAGSYSGTVTVSGGGITKTVSIFMTYDPYLNISTSSLDFGSSKTSDNFTISSNVSWTVSDNKNWISVSPSSGSGDGTVTVQVDRNYLNDGTNTGTVTVTNGGITKTVTITAIKNYSNVNQTSLDFGSSSTSKTFDITSNISWTVNDNKNWITVSPSSGNNNGTAIVQVDRSGLSPGSYSGTVTVSGDGITRTVSISMTVVPYLTVNPTNLDFGSSTSETFDIMSNITWTVNDDKNWISVSPTSGSDDGKVTVQVVRNGLSPDSYLGKVTVSGGGITRTVSISMTVVPYLTVNPTSLDFGSSSTSDTFDITSNISWTVNDNKNWIIVSPTSGSGDGKVTVEVDRSGLKFGSYSGTVTVSGDGITKIVSISMTVVPYLTVNPTNLDFGRSSTSETFDITSNISWTVSDDKNWISVSPSSGSGDGKVTVQVDRNYLNDGTNTGTVIVTNGGITKTVTITAIKNYLTVNPTSLDFGSSKTSDNFTINSNISWTVSDDQNWISESPSSGNNNGTAIVQVDRSGLSPGSYSGTVTVSGDGITRTVSISMTVVPYLTVNPTNLDFGSSKTSDNFTISSNISWTVSDDQNWISESPSSGNNNGTVIVQVDRSGLSLGSYSGTVTVSGDGITRTVSISMTVVPYLTVNPTNLDFGSSKTSDNFNINSNISWAVSDDQNWISESPSSGNNNGTVTVQVDWDGLSPGSYSGTVTVSGDGITETVSISIMVISREITVTSPKEGDNWAQGTPEEITWISKNAGSSVKIDLYKGGSPTRTIESSTSNSEGQNSYNWDIPGDIPDASDYSIKITSIDYPEVSDESDNFTLEKDLKDIWIEGPVTVDERTSTRYFSKATYSNSSNPVDETESTNWSVTVNSSYAQIDSNGILTTLDVPSPQVCQITATFEGKQATKDVTILDIDVKKGPCGKCGEDAIVAMAFVFGYIMVMKRRNNKYNKTVK